MLQFKKKEAGDTNRKRVLAVKTNANLRRPMWWIEVPDPVTVKDLMSYNWCTVYLWTLRISWGIISSSSKIKIHLPIYIPMHSPQSTPLGFIVLIWSFWTEIFISTFGTTHFNHKVKLPYFIDDTKNFVTSFSSQVAMAPIRLSSPT